MTVGLLWDTLLAFAVILILLTVWREAARDDAAQRSLDWEIEKNTGEWEAFKTERSLRLLRDEDVP